MIAGAGRLTGCAFACPENVLQVASAPTVVEIAGNAETYGALLPVGFLIALLHAGRFAARALRDLLERLAARPDAAATA